jgi:membrane protein
MLDSIRHLIRYSFKLSYLALNRLTGGWYGVAVTTIREFSELRSFESGASIAYYALFSLLPLIIFLIFILGLFINSQAVEAQVIRFLDEFFPLPNDEVNALVQQNIQMLVEQRNSMGLLAGVGLLWAGSGVFLSLARNVNRAWHTTAKPLDFLKGRLIAFVMMAALVAVLLFSFISTATLNIIASFELPLVGTAIYQTYLWSLATLVLPYLLSFIAFLAIYRWVPNTEVRWPEALGGALLATIAWRMAIYGFSWSVRIGLINYHVIYGSLATILLVMFWIYISSLILLFGAHFSAAIARHKRPRPEAREDITLKTGPTTR